MFQRICHGRDLRRGSPDCKPLAHLINGSLQLHSQKIQLTANQRLWRLPSIYSTGRSVNDSSTDENFGKDRTDLGVRLRYQVNPELLGELASTFFPLSLDAEGEAFVAAALQRRYRRMTLRAHRFLTLFLSDFDTNALLKCYPVFLLSTPQTQQLLGDTASSCLLDIGAGSGDISTRLAPLFKQLQCTETSRGMARRLAKRGLSCWTGAVGEGHERDPLNGSHRVVSLLNVIDRCPRPRKLLQAIVEQLPDDGRLLLATPLPFDPFFYRGGRTLPPEDKLTIDSPVWETAVCQLVERELQPLGLRVEKLSRMPYLSGGNANHPLYLLDDAVLVCSKRPVRR